MKARPRIDLDGLSLTDADGAVSGALAVFRHRTTDGVVLLMPESADFTVGWEAIEEVSLDLVGGELRLRFTPAYAERANWLRGARTLRGTWLDRLVMGDQPT